MCTMVSIFPKESLHYSRNNVYERRFYRYDGDTEHLVDSSFSTVDHILKRRLKGNDAG